MGFGWGIGGGDARTLAQSLGMGAAGYLTLVGNGAAFTDASGETAADYGELAYLLRDTSGGELSAVQATESYRPTYGREPVTGLWQKLLNTNALSTSPWTALRLSASASPVEPPIAGLAAFRLTEDSATNTHLHYYNVAMTDSANYTFDVYARAGSRIWMALRTTNKAGTQSATYFNLQTGALGNVAAQHTATIAASEEGFYRCRVTVNASTGATQPQLAILLSTGNNILSYAGDGASYIDIAGPQFVDGVDLLPTQVAGASLFDVTQPGVSDTYYVEADGSDNFMTVPIYGHWATLGFTLILAVRAFGDGILLADADSARVVDIDSGDFRTVGLTGTDLSSSSVDATLRAVLAVRSRAGQSELWINGELVDSNTSNPADAVAEQIGLAALADGSSPARSRIFGALIAMRFLDDGQFARAQDRFMSRARPTDQFFF